MKTADHRHRGSFSTASTLFGTRSERERCPSNWWRMLYMLALFLGLVDRLLKLVELQHMNRRQIFEEVAEPLFTELQPVVDDYFSLFRRARMAALKSRRGDDLRQVVVEIHAQWEEMVEARIAVARFADAVQTQVHDKRVNRFARKVDQFFISATARRTRERAGPASLVELLAHVAFGLLDRNTVRDYIDETLIDLESAWVAIGQSYAGLRLYCLTERYYVEPNHPRLARGRH